MSLKTGYKHLMSDIIGILFIIAGFVFTTLDIIYSNNPEYNFHLEWWYIGGMFLLGLVCIFFEPDDIKRLLKYGIRKKLNK